MNDGRGSEVGVPGEYSVLLTTCSDNGDGNVNVTDLLNLLAAWGACS